MIRRIRVEMWGTKKFDTTMREIPFDLRDTYMIYPDSDFSEVMDDMKCYKKDTLIIRQRGLEGRGWDEK